jgi:GntR family transcriptional regulator
MTYLGPLNWVTGLDMLLRSRRHSVPLYTQMAQTLRGEIDSGVWREGECLPPIDDLARRFGVARATVRQAVELLENDGLVRRRQGLGTFVAKPPREQRWFPLASDWTSLLRMVELLEPRLVLSEPATQAPRVSPIDGVAAPAYQLIRRVHYRDGMPFCSIEIYLASHIFDRASDVFNTRVVVPVLEQMRDLSIGKAHQTLTIDGADTATAALLDLPFGGPVAHVRRSIADADGICIYIARIVYRGDVVKLEIDLSPDPSRANKECED